MQPAGSHGPNPAPPGPRPAPGAPPGATRRAPARLARVPASAPDSAHQANLREKGGGGEGRVEPTAGRCGDFAGVLRAGCRGPALSATGPFDLNAPSERAGLLFIPTQFYRGTQFTPTLPMGKPRLGKELYPKPPTYHPTGKWDLGSRGSVAQVPCLWPPSILPGVGSRLGREAYSARNPARAGHRGLAYLGPSCRSHCCGSRRSPQTGRTDQTGCRRRTRSGRTASQLPAPSPPGLGTQGPFKPSGSQAPPPAPATCALEFPGS